MEECIKNHSLNPTEYLRISWPNHSLNVMDRIKKIFGPGGIYDPDLTISCAGGNIKCHATILAISSDFFADFLSANKTDRETHILLPSVSASTFRLIYQYMLEGNVNLPAGQLRPFVMAGNDLKIEGLKGLMLKSLMSSVSDEPVRVVVDDTLASSINPVSSSFGVVQAVNPNSSITFSKKNDDVNSMETNPASSTRQNEPVEKNNNSSDSENTSSDFVKDSNQKSIAQPSLEIQKEIKRAKLDEVVNDDDVDFASKKNIDDNKPNVTCRNNSEDEENMCQQMMKTTTEEKKTGKLNLGIRTKPTESSTDVTTESVLLAGCSSKTSKNDKDKKLRSGDIRSNSGKDEQSSVEELMSDDSDFFDNKSKSVSKKKTMKGTSESDIKNKLKIRPLPMRKRKRVTDNDKDYRGPSTSKGTVRGKGVTSIYYDGKRYTKREAEKLVINCPECLKEMKLSNLKVHLANDCKGGMTTENPKKFSCLFADCGFTCDDPEEVEKHLETHDNKYCCNKCEQMFCVKETYDMHISNCSTQTTENAKTIQGMQGQEDSGENMVEEGFLQ